jgi:hypothetical protein
MLNVATLLLTLSSSPAMIDGTVVDIQATRKFAGKLGYLVKETLTIEASGKRYTVTLSPRHSRSKVVGHQLKVGDPYRIQG